MKYFSDVHWMWGPEHDVRHIIRQDWYEAALLWKYSKISKEGLLEIGRCYGGSAALILEATAHTDRVFTSIDLYPGRGKKREYNARCKEIFNQHTDRFNCVIGDSTKVTVDHNYGFMFVDGDHHYGGVRKDTERHWDKLITGGFAVYHDYSCPNQPGVCKLCDEWVAAGRMKKLEHIGTTTVFEKVK